MDFAAPRASDRRVRAIENYQKSLELDPKNANAAKMIEKLRQPKR